MKKIVLIILTLLLILGTGSAALAQSYFGGGAAVIAEEVTMIKTGLLGKKLCFSDADFKSALALPEFETITVTKLPSSTEGTLLLGGRRVSEGRVIKQKNLGALVFFPASDKVTEAGFSFTVDGYAGGNEIKCTMKFIDKVNYPPEPSDKTSVTTFNTQESISVFGNLTVTDPEGDRIEYIAVAYPKRGSLDIIDKETGRFSYTPKDGFTGKDGFTYVARDEYGNYTEPIKVTLRVNRRMCDTVYADMEGREEYGAAVAMTAMGVMNGKILGDDSYFMPDTVLTKAEFVAMAMKAMGIRADSTLSSTYFDDDSDIPKSLKGYVATAERLGFIGGDFVDGKLMFSPNSPITRYEAAKVMSSIIGVDEDAEESVFAEDDGIPVWARAGVVCMRSVGVFDPEDVSECQATVTRADAADYLYKLMSI